MKKLLSILICLNIIFSLVAFTPNASTPLLSLFISSPQNDLDASDHFKEQIASAKNDQEFADAWRAFLASKPQFEHDLHQWRRMKEIAAWISIGLLAALTGVLVIVTVRKNHSRTITPK